MLSGAEAQLASERNGSHRRRRQSIVRSTLAAMSGGADPRSPDPFEAFYRRAWPDAVRWATALAGSVAAGEDLAQDAFARVRTRFESIDNVDAYLRATIVNVARDARRSSDRRAARELRVVGEPFSPPAEAHEPRILNALARLSYEQRATLVLRYWADWDEAAIAAALGCRASTVRSHAKRGLDALRRLIDANETKTEIER
jgi:RNA polymerase sigma factor (sigma-70 family)